MKMFPKIFKIHLNLTKHLSTKVRVRFAPSPTGKLHFGGLRTAFYNYLFARKNKGKFILRIEDTDRQRYQTDSVNHIIESLKWTGLRPDEGPGFSEHDSTLYFQSNRLELYKKFADRLLKSGHAYKCFCDETRLEFLKKNAAKNQEKGGYDGKCRNLSQSQINELEQQGIPWVLRFKLEDRMIEYEDLVYGHMKGNLAQSETDFVIIKSDGYPVYHFANVVDDHLMDISHVIRGQEWLVSTFKHIQIYEALGLSPPRFVHLPLIINLDGTKLSKRQGALDILTYREKGYYPEALISYLTTFGGGFSKNVEHKPLEELIEDFDLTHLVTIAGKMDGEKLDLLNRHYFKQKCQDSIDELIAKLKELILKRYSIDNELLSNELLLSVLGWAPERVIKLNDLVENEAYRHLWTTNYDENLTTLKTQNFQKDQLIVILDNIMAFIDKHDLHDSKKLKANLTDEFKKLKNELNLTKQQNIWSLIRIAFTGAKEGPPLGDLFVTLGKENLKKRLLYTKNKIERLL
jgi:glutamyl-tRNA synthetase